MCYVMEEFCLNFFTSHRGRVDMFGVIWFLRMMNLTICDAKLLLVAETILDF